MQACQHGGASQPCLPNMSDAWAEVIEPFCCTFGALQKKILAGEARLVRMVAHPNIVRCMQVLETRRQQVGGQCRVQNSSSTPAQRNAATAVQRSRMKQQHVSAAD